MSSTPTDPASSEVPLSPKDQARVDKVEVEKALRENPKIDDKQCRVGISRNADTRAYELQVNSQFDIDPEVLPNVDTPITFNSLPQVKAGPARGLGGHEGL